MELHHRRSIRIPDYDYSLPGAYYVTICAYSKFNFFGNIRNSEMELNNIGQIAFNCWDEILKHFPNVELGNFVIMPNHVHGIIFIIDEKHRKHTAIDRRGTACRAPTVTMEWAPVERFGKPVPGSIPTVIRSYKSAVTNKIHKIPGFALVKIWQRNYYEHIIRSNDDFKRIDAYIGSNPMNWADDELFAG